VPWRAVAIGIVCTSALGLAQQAPASDALILGRVIDGTTGRPVAGALVSISVAAINAGAPASKLNALPTLANADGRFLFRQLPAGRFDLSATALGYPATNRFGARRPGGPSQAIDLAESEKLNNIVIRIWKPAVITGTVMDENGEPLPGVNSVGLLRLDALGGTTRFTVVNGASTDDHGVYRFSSLLPGRYIVFVSSPRTTLPVANREDIDRAMSGTPQERAVLDRQYSGSVASLGPALTAAGFRVGNFILSPAQGGPSLGPAPAADGHVLVAPSVFYPGVATPQQATPIVVEAGEEHAGIDLRVTLVPSVRVSGTVIGPDGPTPHFGLQLMPTSAEASGFYSGMEVADTVTDPTGAFTFLGVPAGTYVVRAIRIPPPPRPGPTGPQVEATGGAARSLLLPVEPSPAQPDEPTLAALVPVAVGPESVTGLQVVLHQGPRVSGRFAFTGSRERPVTDVLTRAAVQVSSVGAAFFARMGAPRFDISADGQFRSTSMPPSRYVLRVSGLPNWTLESAMLDGSDLSDDPFDLDAKDLSGVVITMTDSPAAISGAVRTAAGQVDPDADVLVFPADRTHSADGRGMRRHYLLRVSKAGAFDVTGLPAGEYLLVAVDDALVGDWPDPKFLDALAPLATRVTIALGQRLTQDLITRAVR
jgi:hypothetical protein